MSININSINKNMMNTKKSLFVLLASVMLVVMEGLMTSCSKEDNTINTNGDNLAEMIIGKWMVADMNGQPMATNTKPVFTFVSATKGYMSVSLDERQGLSTQWNDQLEIDVAINDNKITVISHPSEPMTVEEEFTVTDINNKEFTAIRKVTMKIDGKTVFSEEGLTFRFVKVNVDYRKAIIGTWEGHCTSENSVFDDGQEHRWEYRADGSYVYYVKDANDQWVPMETNLSQYFVDGNLLCTRWHNIGETENREWWEIAIDGNTMNWTALRQNADGSTFTATFTMTKVQ